ncbi:hypothetical protein Agabi119p4_10713 [Agaricus bisporus var. burnettii]|uniref:Uncharacterized protein n=1 Tax=Agaricus bisporus var. burnettii TaxID=192524 RepID=A0A8H7EWM7_AGABI|nr:hypothetical protein Agabi119p4_10713 [Agaricus bisporus var. burnettii]
MAASDLLILQRKVDELFTELANYESEKANLEVAKQIGMARGGASIRMTKLKGLIRGAKLRLNNAEKKLKDASALQSELLRQQPLPETSGSRQDLNTEVSETGPMVVDNVMFNQPTNLPNTLDGEGAQGSTELSNANPPTMEPTPSAILEVLNASPQVAIMSSDVIDALVVDPQSTLITPGFTVPPNSEGIQALQILPPALKDVSEKRPISFKRIDRSKSEKEEDSPVDKMDMNLITLEDKTQLQQQWFRRSFTKKPPPTKKVKYMEVSDNSDAAEDPNIFYDEDEPLVQTGVTASTQPGNTNPTVAVQPKPVPPANNIQVSTEGIVVATSKGKGQERKTKGQKMKGTTTSKGKNVVKDPNGGKQTMKLKKIQDAGSNDTDEGGNDREDYHASEYSIAKAARLDSILSKRRERLADPEGHRSFIETWLNAGSAAERTKLPAGMDLVRYDPDYLPDVATANYDLGIKLLLNHSNNYICIPHTKLDRKLISNVDNLEGPVQIWGTPSTRIQNRSSKTNVTRVTDHFHCGCHEKVALAGFVMWKTWKARSLINGQLVVEGLHKHKAFSPREVLFILQFLKSKFGYTVEDMFTGSFDEEEELRKEAAVMKKVANFCACRHYDLIGQKMTLDDKFSEIQEEELKMEWI